MPLNAFTKAFNATSPSLTIDPIKVGIACIVPLATASINFNPDIISLVSIAGSVNFVTNFSIITGIFSNKIGTAFINPKASPHY